MERFHIIHATRHQPWGSLHGREWSPHPGIEKKVSAIDLVPVKSTPRLQANAVTFSSEKQEYVNP